MARERIEVAAERGDVDRHVGHGLGAVDQDGDAPGVGALDDLPDRIHGTEGVRDVDDRDEAGAFAEQAIEGVEFQLAPFVHRDDPKRRAPLLTQELPRHDVGVVFHRRHHHFVPGRDPGTPKAPRYQVDRVGGPANEDDFARVRGAEQARDRVAPRLVGARRPFRQFVDAAVDVGVVVRVEVRHRVDHRLRLLGAGGAVEKDERPAVDLLVEDREIGADPGVLGLGECAAPVGEDFGLTHAEPLGGTRFMPTPGRAASDSHVDRSLPAAPGDRCRP